MVFWGILCSSLTSWLLCVNSRCAVCLKLKIIYVDSARISVAGYLFHLQLLVIFSNSLIDVLAILSSFLPSHLTSSHFPHIQSSSLLSHLSLLPFSPPLLTRLCDNLHLIYPILIVATSHSVHPSFSCHSSSLSSLFLFRP